MWRGEARSDSHGSATSGSSEGTESGRSGTHPFAAGRQEPETFRTEKGSQANGSKQHHRKNGIDLCCQEAYNLRFSHRDTGSLFSHYPGFHHFCTVALVNGRCLKQFRKHPVHSFSLRFLSQPFPCAKEVGIFSQGGRMVGSAGQSSL